MKLFFKLFILLFGLFCFPSSFALASDIALLPLKELPGISPVIVLGDVIHVVPQDNENLDTITIRIHAVLKGDLKEREATFVLSTRGGLKDFDPLLKVGDTGVFFLKQENNTFKKAYWGSIAIFGKNNFSTATAPDAPSDIAALFPRIAMENKPAALIYIAKYGIGRGWTPLGTDSIRIAVQPMGVLSEAYEIDLDSGRGIAFPATHQAAPREAFTLTKPGLQKLCLLLESDEFSKLAPQNSRIGLDGTTCFMEVDIGGRYQWLLHWQPDDRIIRTIVGIVSDEFRSSRP